MGRDVFRSGQLDESRVVNFRAIEESRLPKTRSSTGSISGWSINAPSEFSCVMQIEDARLEVLPVLGGLPLERRALDRRVHGIQLTWQLCCAAVRECDQGHGPSDPSASSMALFAKVRSTLP